MGKYSKTMAEALKDVYMPEGNMDLMRKAASGSAQDIKMKDGKLKMDAFTASAIMKVYDKVNPANKKKIETIINSGKKNQMMKLQSMAMKSIKSEYDAELDEAEYQGRDVPLNKRLPGDVKKSKVFVKNAAGKVVKVNFGDKNMTIKKDNPARRRSFRARHNCDNPGPKTKARYWSCKAW